MAPKRTVATVKLQLEAGRAAPGKVGQILGPHGVNIMAFIRDYDAATQAQRGDVVPVTVTVYEDRSFTFTVGTPPTSFLLRRAAGAGVDAITREQLREVARTKLPDLNTDDLDAAERTVAGTARSMGLTVKE